MSMLVYELHTQALYKIASASAEQDNGHFLHVFSGSFWHIAAGDGTRGDSHRELLDLERRGTGYTPPTSQQGNNSF